MAPPPLFSVLCLALPAWPRKLIDSFFLISFFSFSLVSIFFYIRKRGGFRFLNSIIGPERESRLCALSLDSVRFSSSSARLVFPDFWGKKKRQLRLKANCSGYMEEEQGHWMFTNKLRHGTATPHYWANPTTFFPFFFTEDDDNNNNLMSKHFYATVPVPYFVMDVSFRERRIRNKKKESKVYESIYIFEKILIWEKIKRIDKKISID